MDHPPECRTSILEWWAVSIAKNVTVYGRRPPSSVLEKITPKELKHFDFCEGGSKLKDPNQGAVYYTDVVVEREGVIRTI